MSLANSIKKSYSEYRFAKRTAKEEAAQAKALKKQEQDILSALSLAQQVAEKVQQQAHFKIASVVSKCLNSVFDFPYQFKIEFERKRSSTEARIVFVRDGESFDPLEETAGGAVDVAAFALRLVNVLISRPRNEKVLIMDEPFRFVSEKYREHCAELIKSLAEELDFQFVLVTHIDAIKVGKVIEL